MRYRLGLPDSKGIFIFLAALAWASSVFGTILVPIDVAVYRQAFPASGNTTSGFLSTTYSDRVIKDVWTLLYWLTFVLTWFVLPIGIAFEKSGEFSAMSKLRSVAIGEAKYYTFAAATATIIVGIIVAVEGGTETLTHSIAPVLMAASNAYGLFLIVLCLGYGLVAVPIEIWEYADTGNVRAERMERRAEERHRDLVTSKTRLSRVVRTVLAIEVEVSKEGRTCDASVVQRTNHLSILAGQVSADRADTPVASDGTASSGVGELPVAWQKLSARQKQGRLVELHEELREAVSLFHQTRGIWHTTIRRWARAKMETKTCIRTWTLRALAFLCAALSLCVLWDELSLLIVPTSDVSIVGALMRKSSPPPPHDNDASITTSVASGSLTVGLFYAYVSTCAYASFLKIRIPGAKAAETHVYAHRLSEASALMFVGCYLCRMQFSLGYHFLMIIEGRHGRLCPSAFRSLYDFSTSAWASWFYAIFPLSCVLFAAATVYRRLRRQTTASDAVARSSSSSYDGDLARALLQAGALRLNIRVREPQDTVRKLPATAEAPLLATSSPSPSACRVIMREALDVPADVLNRDDDLDGSDAIEPILPVIDCDDIQTKVVGDDRQDDDEVSAKNSEGRSIQRTDKSEDRVVCEGYLLKRSDVRRQWRRRRFRLEDRTMTYFADQEDGSDGPCRGTWCLVSAEPRSYRPSRKGPAMHGFALRVSEKRMKVHLCTASAIDALRWWTALSRALETFVPERVREAAGVERRESGGVLRRRFSESGSLLGDFLHDDLGEYV
eukprot:g2211.t1